MKSLCSLLLLFITGQFLAAADIWQEAESPLRHNWSGKALMAQPDGSGASDGYLLRLYTGEAPGAEGYFAEYTVNAPEDGEYRLWVAASPTNAGWASPFEFIIDGSTEIDFSECAWQTPSFGGPAPDAVLGWMTPGTVELTEGEHQVVMRVSRPRGVDANWIAFFDGFWLTTDLGARPLGRYHVSPRQPDFNAEVAAAGSYNNWLKRKEGEAITEVLLRSSPEDISDDAIAGEVRARIAARPLPPAQRAPGRRNLIGVHGMEMPFVRVDENAAEAKQAFELLARAGVDSLRTAEPCWHRLGAGAPETFDWKEIEFQAEQARLYGMKFMFTFGYPPADYAKVPSHLSTFAPQYEEMFREYLRMIFSRYDDVADYWEYANEVDAPSVWWRGATPEEYARDCRIAREEMDRLGIATPLLGISATYSRDASQDRNGGGQEFSRRTAAAGTADAVDGYSIHYTWPLAQQGFVEFFRELSPEGPSRLLVNSEESGYSHPSDVIKMMARDFYLYGLEAVYYYLAKDWVEAGNALYCGLFDIEWRPKKRLLSLAAAADAMKFRGLAGMASPESGIEAYLLEPFDDAADRRYAVVLWQNGYNEELGPGFEPTPALAPVAVSFPAGSVVGAVDWELSDIPFDAAAPQFPVDNRPLVVYCTELPAWDRYSPADWLKKKAPQPVSGTDALVPGA